MTWIFAASIGEHRINSLSSAPDFETIADAVAEDGDILCAHDQPCNDQAGFYRAVYCMRIDRDLFDRFFNSAKGYRGAFYRSPFEGLAANTSFVNRIRSSLVGTSRDPDYGIDPASSLDAGSAKVWVAEKSMELCDHCEGEWSVPSESAPEIRNGRWDKAEGCYSAYGVKAPYFTKLRIFGGFINSRRDEFIPFRKRRRAFEIHDFGWS